MNRRTRKSLFFAAKLVVAILLLGWVVAQVHWRDYVQTRDGRNGYAVVESPRPGQQTIRVDTGRPWRPNVETRPVSEFAPIAGGRSSGLASRPASARSTSPWRWWGRRRSGWRCC